MMNDDQTQIDRPWWLIKSDLLYDSIRERVFYHGPASRGPHLQNSRVSVRFVSIKSMEQYETFWHFCATVQCIFKNLWNSNLLRMLYDRSKLLVGEHRLTPQKRFSPLLQKGKRNFSTFHWEFLIRDFLMEVFFSLYSIWAGDCSPFWYSTIRIRDELVQSASSPFVAKFEIRGATASQLPSITFWFSFWR